MVLPTRLLSVFAAVCSLSSYVQANTHRYLGPRNVVEWREERPYGHPPKDHRRKFYIRPSRSDTDDVSAEFYRGLQRANNGGTLVLPGGNTYIIAKKLDLTFLNDVQVLLDGEIKFTDNITYWQNNYFYHPFQKSIMFWKWGGKDIKIFGTGTLNGNGQAWYDGFAGREILDANNTYYRPILFYAENCTNLLVEGISMINSPVWHNFIVTSKNVAFRNIFIEGKSNNKNLPKNSDGWDTLNVDGFEVSDAWVNNGDDCVSPKANTTNILIQNVYCNGSHGISMGSVGQYPGVKDIIEHVWVENITMLNAENGARLKSWAGPKVGYGYINNVTFKNFYSFNVDWPIVLDACYFNIPTAQCTQFPSRVNITNILFQNFTGSSSGKEGKFIADLSCSSAAVCENIRLVDINLTYGNSSSKGDVECAGIAGGVGVPCISG